MHVHSSWTCRVLCRKSPGYHYVGCHNPPQRLLILKHDSTGEVTWLGIFFRNDHNLSTSIYNAIGKVFAAWISNSQSMWKCKRRIAFNISIHLHNAILVMNWNGMVWLIIEMNSSIVLTDSEDLLCQCLLNQILKWQYKSRMTFF